MLGDEFLEHNSRQIRSDGARSAGTGVGAPHSRRNSRNGGAGDESAPDLGILKALSSMGTAAKRNLSQLAERFQNNGGGTGGANDHGDRSATAREFKPLVDSGGNSYEVGEGLVALCIVWLLLFVLYSKLCVGASGRGGR